MRPRDFFVGPVEHGQLADDRRLAACGRASLGTIIEIRDELGQRVPAGQPGEICVMSDLAMAGYYKNPEETAKVIRGGFVHTGDVGTLDCDGFLTIVDRKKDLVISGGVNIYPSEIEQVLCTHEAVAECAVVGLPHADWGEMVAAVVRLRPGGQASPEQLIAFVRARLGPINCPKLLRIWEELPSSGIGKILKNQIRQALSATDSGEE
jgi:acyl-CoA synthetase (AMP-forming)/AMP-acid ligase II